MLLVQEARGLRIRAPVGAVDEQLLDRPARRNDPPTRSRHRQSCSSAACCVRAASATLAGTRLRVASSAGLETVRTWLGATASTTGLALAMTSELDCGRVSHRPSPQALADPIGHGMTSTASRTSEVWQPFDVPLSEVPDSLVGQVVREVNPWKTRSTK